MQASESKLTVWRTMHSPSSGSKQSKPKNVSLRGPLHICSSPCPTSSLGTLLGHACVLCFPTFSSFSLPLVWFTFDLEDGGVLSSEMVVTFHQTTQHHIPDDSILAYPSLPVGDKLNVLA